MEQVMALARPKHDDLLRNLQGPLLWGGILALILAASCIRGVEVYHQSWSATEIPGKLVGQRHSVVLYRGDLLLGSVRVAVWGPTDEQVVKLDPDGGLGMEWATWHWHSMYTEREGIGGLGWFEYPSRQVARTGITRPGTVERWAQGVAILWWFTLFLLGALPVLVALLRFDHGAARARKGLCSRCGYDVHATPQRCPECGQILGVGEQERGHRQG